MDATLQRRAEEFASEIANQLQTAEDLTDLMRLMMKSGLERMLNTELDVHLGRRSAAIAEAPTAVVESAEPAGKRRPNRRN